MPPGRSRRTSPKKKAEAATSPPEGVKSAPLEPIRMVERELTRPDGSTLKVKVPVYPPFELAERPATKVDARKRKPPTKKAS